MSVHQGRHYPKGNTSGSTALASALSAAFAQSGILPNARDRKAAVPINPPSSAPPPPAREPAADHDLFLQAMAGATPLNTSQPGNSLERREASQARVLTNNHGQPIRRDESLPHKPRNQSKSQSAKQPGASPERREASQARVHANNHEQPKRKSQSLPNKRRNQSKSQSDKPQQDRPEVHYRIGPDGRLQVAIPGVWLEFNGDKKQGKNSVPQSPPATTELVVNGRVTLSPSLCRDTHRSDFSNTHAAWGSYPGAGAANGEVELVIGLDFGTSFCKVVVQEPIRPQAWAIPFSANEHNPFTLATKVWEEDSSFHLDPSGRAFSNLKMALFGETTAAEADIRATAFVALVLRHAKNWIWRHKANQFPDQTPFWQVNLGIPARNFENKWLVERFKTILCAGMLLAENPSRAVSKADVTQALSAVVTATGDKDATITLKGFGTLYRDQINVYPEIAAQIYGFLRSEYRDPNQNTFMLVDVGGGTVDAALFHVAQPQDGDATFVFLASAVEPLGVYMLHRERIHWFVDQLSKLGANPETIEKLRTITSHNWMPDVVPGSISEYVRGVQYPEYTSDRDFYNSFSRMLWYNIIMAARQKVAGGLAEAVRTQFLLSGGGRTIALYNKFIELINSPKSNSTLRLHSIAMGVPNALQAQRIGTSEFHRLSVAYGLSFSTIGKIVTSDMLRAAPVNAYQMDYQNFFIGKEMM